MAVKEKELQELMASIPKEHRRTMNKLIKLAVLRGRAQVLDLVRDLADVPIEKVTEYGIWHEDCLDGG